MKLYEPQGRLSRLMAKTTSAPLALSSCTPPAPGRSGTQLDVARPQSIENDSSTPVPSVYQTRS